MDEPVLRILLVEDNPADARLLRENLAASGAENVQLTHVERLSEAIRCLTADRFDLVLLDLSLPDSTSLDTVLRLYAEAPRTPIVVLTGADDEVLGIAAVRRGAQDYLVKGQTDSRLLLRSIRYALERHKAEEALAKYRDSLEELVAHRTAALEATNEALQEQIAERIRAEAALEMAHRKLATDRERQRLLLASELHDSIGQELIAMKLALERAMTADTSALCPETNRLLSGAIGKCQSLIRQVRTISHGLYPPGLQAFGLVPALRQLAADCQSSTPLAVHCAAQLESARFPNEVEIAAFRIAQEAVQNALRHSQAGRIDIRVSFENGALLLNIVDNGVGLDPARPAGSGLGFISMKERAVMVGGNLQIASRPGETCVEVRIPTELRAAS